jgi:hypothetical protein
MRVERMSIAIVSSITSSVTVHASMEKRIGLFAGRDWRRHIVAIFRDIWWLIDTGWIHRPLISLVLPNETPQVGLSLAREE